MMANEVGISRRRPLFWLIWALSCCVAAFAAGEAALRLKGFRPWGPASLDLEIEPGGSLYLPDSALGYVLRPGEYRVTLPSGYSFSARHTRDSHRVTRADSRAVGSEQIWIFGCSLSYGWAVDDDETYPWLLQQRFPGFDIVNFATSGYGTLHSLLQFRQALEAGARPKLALIAYATFHDERNVWARIRRKQISHHKDLRGVRQPTARLDGGRLRYGWETESSYPEPPLIRVSSLVNFLDGRFNAWELRRLGGAEVSEAILAEMAALARERGTELVVADIGFRSGWESRGVDPHGVLEFAKRRGIRAVDISLDLTQSENNNAPHDSHPSALAHKRYARRVAEFIGPLLGGN